jgi:hypothetical protein
VFLLKIHRHLDFSGMDISIDVFLEKLSGALVFFLPKAIKNIHSLPRA